VAQLVRQVQQALLEQQELLVLPAPRALPEIRGPLVQQVQQALE
jgi:hypothetical protein